jgi:hypothetical protein
MMNRILIQALLWQEHHNFRTSLYRHALIGKYKTTGKLIDRKDNEFGHKCLKRKKLTFYDSKTPNLIIYD